MTTKVITKKAASVMPVPQAPAASKPAIKKARAPQVAPKTNNSASKARTGKTEAARRTSKIDTLVQMMRAKHGASIDQLSKATGWQNHSVRGAISGNIKKKLGLNVASAAVNGVRTYRIVK